MPLHPPVPVGHAGRSAGHRGRCPRASDDGHRRRAARPSRRARGGDRSGVGDPRRPQRVGPPGRARPHGRGARGGRRDRRRGGHRDHRVVGALRRPRPSVVRRQGRDGGGHRALRAGLRQRLLGRQPAGLRRRGRPRLRPVHQAHRRAGPRAVPRRHAVHRRPHLPGPVGRHERVDLGRLRRLHQAALPRPGRGRRRLARGGGHLPARHQRSRPAVDVGPRDGVRRPADRQGPPGRVDGRLRRDDRRQRRRAPQQRHPQPGLRARGAGDRRRLLERRRPDLVRRPHLRHPGRQRLRHLRGSHRRGRR